MKKSLLLLLFVSLSTMISMAALTADWKIYNMFDSRQARVIETPTRVYTLSRTFEYNPSRIGRDFNSYSLHYYDKEGDEMIPVNERTNASGTVVSAVQYNPRKKYLLVVYTDCNIDFIYDDGRVENLPAIKATSIPGKKVVNDITFDYANNKAYLATSFGYVVLDDKKHEVAESRIYNENIMSAARVGDYIALIKDYVLHTAPVSESRFSLDDYTKYPDYSYFDAIYPADTNDFYAVKFGWNGYIYDFSSDEKGFFTGVQNEQTDGENNVIDVQPISRGIYVVGNVRLYSIANEGESYRIMRPQSEYSKPCSSLNFYNIWTLTNQDGLKTYVYSDNKWSLLKDYMRPNSPATFLSTSMAYHPTYGMLVGSNGPDLAYSENSQETPCNVSALDGSFWKEYSPVYTIPDRMKNPNNYYGLAVDPANKNHVYRGSITNGLIRIDLSDPSKLLVMANPSNRNNGIEGFVKVADDLSAWNVLCRFSEPQFSNDGTLWTLYNYHDTKEGRLIYWPQADRLASTSASNFRKWNYIAMPNSLISSNMDVMITLKSNANKNVVVIGGFQNDGTILIYDHNGTPGVTSDDKYTHLFSGKVYDQDGGATSFTSINNLYEDTESGLVWVMTPRGIFTVNPRTALDAPGSVVMNRIKVSRDDGTNLADYLLNEINVNHMAEDGEGRKWFATSNGLVCTSSDGKKILAEFTKENSYLPDDNIYHVAYNPQHESMMLSTGAGLVEMFPSGSGKSKVADGGPRIYPNPVEPDFYGWVRIDNVADGSLVKITDGQGGLVKELGLAEGGAVEWDLTGLNNNRVPTGVYYVMVSPGADGGNASINKILVFN